MYTDILINAELHNIIECHFPPLAEKNLKKNRDVSTSLDMTR